MAAGIAPEVAQVALEDCAAASRLGDHLERDLAILAKESHCEPSAPLDAIKPAPTLISGARWSSSSLGSVFSYER